MEHIGEEYITDLTPEEQDRFWLIWRIAQSDHIYHKMLEQIGPMERAYEKVLQSLTEEQQNVVCDFVSQCEGMSHRMLEVACKLMDFPRVKRK